MGKGVLVPGETNLHKTLKKEACHWLFRMGYQSIAAEVRIRPVGIIDAVGAGIFRGYHNYLAVPHPLPQVCFIECKASRSDFLRDLDEDGQFLFELQRHTMLKVRRRRRRDRLRCNTLGKFKTCLARPMANLHYILAPAGLLQKKDLPPRWGLLALGEGGISVIVKSQWQEVSRCEYVESAIARTLTGDIYRADSRAMSSINREIFAQQEKLASRIRNMKPQIVLAPPTSAVLM
jgi:hypothetical protein